MSAGEHVDCAYGAGSQTSTLTTAAPRISSGATCFPRILVDANEESLTTDKSLFIGLPLSRSSPRQQLTVPSPHRIASRAFTLPTSEVHPSMPDPTQRESPPRPSRVSVSVAAHDPSAVFDRRLSSRASTKDSIYESRWASLYLSWPLTAKTAVPDSSATSPLSTASHSSTSSSSAASSLSLSSVPAGFSSATLLLARRSRLRAGSPMDRVLSKRRRQRECDSRRRQKETVGYSRLYALLAVDAGQPQLSEQQQQSEQREADETDRKLAKVDILHRSAERIEQLERRLLELTDGQCRRDTLHSTMLSQSTVCLLSIHAPSGVVVDCSEQYLRQAGFERAWLVGRRFWPSHHSLTASPLSLTRPSPATAGGDRSSFNTGVVLCKPPGRPLQETRQQPQSERSVRQLQRLYEGVADAMYGVWRSQLGDGGLHDEALHAWVSDWLDDDGVDGRRGPLYVLRLVNSSETVCVD